MRVPPPPLSKGRGTIGRQTRVSGAAYLEHVGVGVGVILDDDGLGPTECVRHRVLLGVLYQLINTTTNKPVLRPTMNCIADWSKCRHATLITIE